MSQKLNSKPGILCCDDIFRAGGRWKQQSLKGEPGCLALRSTRGRLTGALLVAKWGMARSLRKAPGTVELGRVQ